MTLSGTAVSVDADGVSLPGKLHFISPRQVNAQIPWEVAGKQSVKIKVWSDYFASNVITVPLAQYAPGIFEVSGLAAAQVFPTFALITRQAPAKRGDTIILYVNGLGPVTNPPASGEASSSSQTTVLPTVTIGNRPAQVLFSGLTPGAIGLYQINLTVAADTPTGDQPIVVTIGGVSSKGIGAACAVEPAVLGAVDLEADVILHPRKAGRRPQSIAHEVSLGSTGYAPASRGERSRTVYRRTHDRTGRYAGSGTGAATRCGVRRRSGRGRGSGGNRR